MLQGSDRGAEAAGLVQALGHPTLAHPAHFLWAHLLPLSGPCCFIRKTMGEYRGIIRVPSNLNFLGSDLPLVPLQHGTIDKHVDIEKFPKVHGEAHSLAILEVP